jgi:hypothetical protein
MKRVFAGLLLCSALGAWGQSSKEPYMVPRPTETFDYDAFMLRLEKMKAENPTLPKSKLGPIDQWRFESCQTDAAKAPTSQGVFQGMRVCREKFGQ